jgi:hypothetical protein
MADSRAVLCVDSSTQDIIIIVWAGIPAPRRSLARHVEVSAVGETRLARIGI